MPYKRRIDREHKGCFLFLLDQSGSMEDPFSGEAGTRKADKLADAVNRMLDELIIRSTRDQSGIPRDYYDIGIFGYGDEGIQSAFGDRYGGSILVSLPELSQAPARFEQRLRREEDGAGGLVQVQVTIPIWIDPVARGGTPMCAALRAAHAVLEPWVAQHVNSYPPIVVNITDGESTDGDPVQLASDLRSLATYDGNVLLFNLHLSSAQGPEILFPEEHPYFPDQYARLLYEMSSTLPEGMQGYARQEGFRIGATSRGFVFNAHMTEVVKFLDIGTKFQELR